MQPLDLHRAEQGLRAGVVPAGALPTHGSLDAMLREQVRVATTGILAAAIAMEDQAARGQPALPRHVERTAGQRRVDRRTHDPAHDATA
jgi:hypothetical protein